MPVDDFLQYLTAEKRYSHHTVAAYRSDLNGFVEWCGGLSDATFSAVERKQIRRWLAELSASGLSARTINRKLTAVRSLFRYMKRQGLVDVNPAEAVSLMKPKKQLPVFVESKAIDMLFENLQFGDDFEGCRDRLILEMFYATGMRLSELVSLRLESVDVAERKIQVEGKRKKQRIVPITENLQSCIQRYLEQRSQKYSASRNFFLTQKGEPVYPKLVYRVVNRYLSLVSSQEKLSPHVLRHTFATHMLNNGADLNAVKELLGHANLAATQIYTHNTFEKLKSIYNKAHPRT